MRRLVALDIPPGPRFLEEIERAFDSADAVFPIDARLPGPARERLLAAIRPTDIVTENGRFTHPGGRPVEEGDALVVATSGTTGEAKGVVLTTDAVAASAWATSRRLGVDPKADRWCSCLPLAHVGGLSVLTRALVTNTPVEVLARFDPTQVADAAKAGATLVSLVPTALARFDDHALYRKILLGGAAPLGELGENVVVTYGMTETGSGVVYDGTALDGVEVALRAGGAIAVRGPMLLRAYRDGSDPKDADGWLVTGDIGSFDAAGRLMVHGRADECIVTGGENVWPDAVEAVLGSHDAIAEVAVCGVADQEWGARVVAFAVCRETPPKLEELRDLVRAELGAFAAPRELVVVDALPRTASGKVRRSELATRAPQR